MTKRYLLPAAVVAVVVAGMAGVVTLTGQPGAAVAEVAMAPAASPTVAKVGNDVVTQKDVEQLYTAIKARMGEGVPPLDKIFWTLTDQIVASRLIIGAANAEGLPGTPEVQTAIKGATEQIVQEAFIRKVFAGLDDAAVLKPRYDKMVAGMKDEIEVSARHILVDDEAKAKALIAELGKGADFAKLAKENSKDRGSAEKGGDLGFFAKGMMVPEFDAAAFALEPGKVAQSPVKTQFGWHVLKVEQRRSRQAPEFDKVKGDLLNEVQQEKLNAAIATLKAKNKVELMAVPGVPPLPTSEGVVPATAP